MSYELELSISRNARTGQWNCKFQICQLLTRKSSQQLLIVYFLSDNPDI